MDSDDWPWLGQQPVDLAGYVSFEAAQDLAVCFSFGAATVGVGLGFGVGVEPDHGDAPQGAVGLAVATSVQAMSNGLPGGSFDRGGAAERGESGLAAHALGVVARG